MKKFYQKFKFENTEFVLDNHLSITNFKLNNNVVFKKLSIIDFNDKTLKNKMDLKIAQGLFAENFFEKKVINKKRSLSVVFFSKKLFLDFESNIRVVFYLDTKKFEVKIEISSSKKRHYSPIIRIEKINNNYIKQFHSTLMKCKNSKFTDYATPKPKKNIEYKNFEISNKKQTNVLVLDLHNSIKFSNRKYKVYNFLV